MPLNNIVFSGQNQPVDLNNLDPDINSPSICNSKYYSTSEFAADFDISNCVSGKHFSALHSNIRSLNANIDKLTQLLHELHHNFSIIGLSETKLKVAGPQTIFNNQIPGYNFVSQPSLSNSGGVAFYISNDLAVFTREDISCTTPDFEALWIEIKSNLQHNIVCGVIYRHPHSNLNAFLDYLDNTVTKLNSENKYSIIMGDFNIDLLKTNCHTDTDNFLRTLESCFYSPHILQPTRITDHSATLIDNIFFNSLSHHTISGNIYYDLSDHLPNFLIVKKLHYVPKNIEIFKRDYSKYSKTNLVEDIASINWDSLPHCDNVSDMFDQFYQKISNVVDQHLPLKRLSKREIKQQSKPWITKGIITSIRIKNSFYRKFMKSKSSYYYNKYKFYRNRVNRIVKISKTKYYNKFFDDSKTNIRKVWRGIREIVGSSKNHINIPSKFITENNVEITDSRDIANHFNSFFSNVGSSLAQAIPQSNKSALDFLPDQVQELFSISPVNIQEIIEEIENLDANKASGPYSIPTKILKLAKNHIAEPLTLIMNTSFSTGVVPECLKIANIIPVFKQGSQINFSNYRPISLLSIFNRILEKLMSKRLIKFLDEKNLLNNKQFGFRKNHSTTHAVLSIVNNIQCAIEANEYSCGIFLDLSKAFDTVNHQILLTKLNHYGIFGTAGNWFLSYLSNRKQFVTIGNIKSEILTVNCGVPQGSVLGPTLFLLYINDLINTSKLLSFHLFADDSNLFYSHKNLNELQAIMNVELESIYSWLCANKLSLNIDKSNVIIFHTPQKKVHGISICINNVPLKQVNELKYLGVMLDSNINWKAHVSYISCKIKRSVVS